MQKKTLHEFKKRAQRLPNLPLSAIDDFIESSKRIKTSPFGITKKKLGVLLTGLLAASYLHIQYQAWNASAFATSMAKADVIRQSGYRLIDKPMADLKEAEKKLFDLGERLNITLPADMKNLMKDIQESKKTVNETATRVQALQADVHVLCEFGDPLTTIELPRHIQQDLQAILVRTILKPKKNLPTLPDTGRENPIPLLTDGRPSGGKTPQKKNQIILLDSNVALTPEQMKVVADWQTEFNGLSDRMQKSMFDLVIDGYLSRKMEELKGAKTALEIATEKLATIQATKRGLEEQKEKKKKETPTRRAEIVNMTKLISQYKKDFQGKITLKKEYLYKQKLNGSPFSALEYYLMGDSLIICTLLFGTTGPLINMFDSNLKSFFLQAAAILSLVVKTFHEGNANTMGNLLMKTFGITMYFGMIPMPDRSKWTRTRPIDEIIYMAILIIVSLLLIGQHSIQWFANTFGFTTRALHSEIRSLKQHKQRLQAKLVHAQAHASKAPQRHE
jgi:hypothetical protein